MTTAVGERRKAVEEELDAEYAGAGWWGSLYRAPHHRRWYRLIPVEELSGRHRSELLAWQARPRRPDLVPVVPTDRSDQRQFAGRWFQVVCYETDARRSLAHAVAEDEPADRIASVAGVLRALPGWCAAVGAGLVALPADVVLAGHRPLLLPLPSWGPPPLGRVLAEPERLAHLTPEAARGLPVGVRPPGLHALLVAALRCFEELPDGEAGRLLQRTACAALFTDQRRDGRLPSWMRRVAPVRDVRRLLRDLTGFDPAAAGAADPLHLADILDTARSAMDPVTAVRARRAEGEARLAVGLAHAALVDRPDYDLLLLAAEIAREDLRDPLEALSLLERAVQTSSERTEAYAEQLSIIGGLWSVLQGRLAGAIDRSFAERLEATARTAFDRLPPAQRRDKAHEMARCLIGQGRLAEANAFVHRWLHDGGTLMWWRFDLMLDYAETFLLLGRTDAAGQVAQEVRAGLGRVRQNGQMPHQEIHRYGMRLADFDHALLAARNQEGKA
ncbi:hypothetical protein [Streptomyces minutiscleroticus]|uniref:hypothetical protein n=1 Tax=Streptomyces minutiscleroticus TaxID=68238 RepID=UPI003333371F